MTKYRPTLSVDFDGTIVEHKFPKIGRLQPGVKEALEKLSKTFNIVISSCRSSKMFMRKDDGYVQEMEEFLKINKIPYDRIDMGDEGKVVASYYIDDRAVEFKSNWEEVAERILSECI